MNAVFKHELGSYFTGLTAYVFGFFLLLFAGIYTMVYCLRSGIANFELVLGSMAFVFIVIVPILTMRVLAEERRQKTDILLYSLPISTTKIVLGKFFAMLVILLIPVAVIGLYPLILRAFGAVYLPAAYAAIFGFLCVGAAMLAIGMFISSLTESQAVAAGICFVVMLINFFGSSLASYVSASPMSSVVAFSVIVVLIALLTRFMTKSDFTATIVGCLLEIGLIAVYVVNSSLFSGLFGSIMAKLSIFDRFYTIVNGVLKLTDVVYFLTVIAIFLFLSVQSFEKRRWSE